MRAIAHPLPGVPSGDAVSVAAAAPPPAPADSWSAGDLQQILKSMQASIRGAELQELGNPESDCRKAIDVLVNLAAGPGWQGDASRVALGQLYMESIGSEKRDALLNAAFAMSQQTFLHVDDKFKEAVKAAVQVVFLGAHAPEPPLGDNGPGHTHRALAYVARQLGPDFHGQPDLLALDQPVPGSVQMAASAQLENLKVREQPISVATPDAGRKSFEQMTAEVLKEGKTVTVWVSNGAGHFIPVVAEPSSEGIRFHVIAPPGDELSPQVCTTLQQLPTGDCVIGVDGYEVENPCLALKHLNDNPDDVRGAGGVIREHADHVANLSKEDRRAIDLASRAEVLQAAASRPGNAQAGEPSSEPQRGVIATPAAPQAPEIVVTLPDVPGATPIVTPPQPQPPSPATASRVELQTQARAMGFSKDAVGNTTNIWGEMAGIMNTHQGTLTAGYFERRKLSREVERQLNGVPPSHRRLATAVMKASAVPSTLAGSPLWAHLDNVRNANRARLAEDLREDGAVGRPQTVGASILESEALAVGAFPAQLMARLMLLSTDIAKEAAYVTSNDPADKRHRIFNNRLSELQSYVQGVGKWIDSGIEELDAVLGSTDRGVTNKMKEDARTMRAALVGLKAAFQDPEGVPQQVLKFTGAALLSPDNVQMAADALIV